MNQITVEVRNVYGVETVYPVCEKARLFASIAGTKTLTDHMLREIQRLGFEVREQQKSRFARAA